MSRMGEGSRRIERDILDSVLHDLRQPLTALRLDLAAALNLLRRDEPSAEAAAAVLDDAIDDVRSMQQILDTVQGQRRAAASNNAHAKST